MDNELKLYRKRLIPFECILLKDDVVLRADDEVVVTKWNVLRPKKELRRGYSCYYLKKGIKVSAFIGEGDRLLYWYCDIVDYGDGYVEESASEADVLGDAAGGVGATSGVANAADGSGGAKALTVTDLLADVIIYPNGKLQVVDLDELAAAYEQALLSSDLMLKSLRNLNALLGMIYDGSFEALKAPILAVEVLQS